jgi:GT2 family glycosyltransferase
MPVFLVPAPPVHLRSGARPTFSVVIPAYQAAATIADAIASARSQTVPPAEIIVCDDGSTDDLDGAIEPHRASIKLIRQANQGVVAARNALLRAAAADFVVPLDADDVYAPTRLQRLGELAAARPDLDILATDANFVVEGRVVGRFNGESRFPLENQREAILEHCFLICPAMRRESLLSVGGYDEQLSTAEDWDCCIRMIHAGASAGLVDEALLEYRLGSDSLTSSRGETLMDRVRVLEKATAQSGLSDNESRVAQAALARHRERALQQVAREAVHRGEPNARGRLLAVARSRDVAIPARAAALVAACAPGKARRLVDAALSESTGRPPALRAQSPRN